MVKLASLFTNTPPPYCALLPLIVPPVMVKLPPLTYTPPPLSTAFPPLIVPVLFVLPSSSVRVLLTMKRRPIPIGWMVWPFRSREDTVFGTAMPFTRPESAALYV